MNGANQRATGEIEVAQEPGGKFPKIPKASAHPASAQSSPTNNVDFEFPPCRALPHEQKASNPLNATVIEQSMTQALKLWPDVTKRSVIAALDTKFADGDATKAITLLQFWRDAVAGHVTSLGSSKSSQSVPLRGAVNFRGVSCYMNSLLMAMFSRLENFEPLLYLQSFEDPNVEILATWLRFFVNLLRNGELITCDIVEGLLAACCNAGWASETPASAMQQQDAAELFAFITEKLRMPLLALKVDIAHAGKEVAEEDHKLVQEQLLYLPVPGAASDPPIPLEECLEVYFSNAISVSRHVDQVQAQALAQAQAQAQAQARGYHSPTTPQPIAKSSGSPLSSPVTPSTPSAYSGAWPGPSTPTSSRYASNSYSSTNAFYTASAGISDSPAYPRRRSYSIISLTTPSLVSTRRFQTHVDEEQNDNWSFSTPPVAEHDEAEHKTSDGNAVASESERADSEVPSEVPSEAISETPSQLSEDFDENEEDGSKTPHGSANNSIEIDPNDSVDPMDPIDPTDSISASAPKPDESSRNSNGKTDDSSEMRVGSLPTYTQLFGTNGQLSQSDACNAQAEARALDLKKSLWTSKNEIMLPAWMFLQLMPFYAVSKPGPDDTLENLEAEQVARHFGKARPVLGFCLKRYFWTEQGRPQRNNRQVIVPETISLPSFVADDSNNERAFGNFKLVLESAVFHRGNNVHSGHYCALVGESPKTPKPPNTAAAHPANADAKRFSWLGRSSKKSNTPGSDGSGTFVASSGSTGIEKIIPSIGNSASANSSLTALSTGQTVDTEPEPVSTPSREKTWLLCDDMAPAGEKIKNVDFNEIFQKETPYMLFYRMVALEEDGDSTRVMHPAPTQRLSSSPTSPNGPELFAANNSTHNHHTQSYQGTHSEDPTTRSSGVDKKKKRSKFLRLGQKDYASRYREEKCTIQ